MLILTTFEVDEYVFAALRAGAGGFLLKDAEPDALLHAIRVVAAGEALLSPSVTRRVVEVFAGGSAPDAPQAALLAELTDREREIVALVAGGLSNGDIARAARHQPRDRPHARLARDDQARRARPRAARRVRVRERDRRSRPARCVAAARADYVGLRTRRAAAGPTTGRPAAASMAACPLHLPPSACMG